MGMVVLWYLRPFSKASQEEGFGQIKGQPGKAQEVKSKGMMSEDIMAGEAKARAGASACLECKVRSGQSHQQVEFSKGRGGTVEEVRLQPALVLITQPHSST